MELTNTYSRLDIVTIKVNREGRQRKELSTDGLVDSVRRHGVLNPILVDKERNLIAGERRLEASKEVGLDSIPARFIEDLTIIEAQTIELEENLQRSDLTWRDNCAAISKLHSLFTEQHPSWTHQQTSEAIGIQSTGHIAEILRVAKDLDSPRLELATSIRSAYNILSRLDSRKADDVMSSILEAGAKIFEPKKSGAPTNPALTPVNDPAPDHPALINADFTQWAETYDGPSFNFLHCDFPYGIGVFKGQMSGRDKQVTYDDQPDVYWQLIKTLCKHRGKLMSRSSHLMFWFSMEWYQETLDAFHELAPDLVFNPFPLVWMKSDNVGILPDAKRGPRRIYETALIATREDRMIVKPIANAYAAPTDKAHHTSTKPVPVLKHFFQMFIDETTIMLDPTCGSGSALRAAECLGAKSVFGIEKDPEHFASANSALRNFRALKKASSHVG